MKISIIEVIWPLLQSIDKSIDRYYKKNSNIKFRDDLEINLLNT